MHLIQENNFSYYSTIDKNPVLNAPFNHLRENKQKVSVFVTRSVVINDLFLSPYDEAGEYKILTMERYIEKVSTLVSLYKFDKEYELLKQINFDSILFEDDIFYISSSEVKIYGAGRTIERAKEDSVSMLINLFESFNSDKYPLSYRARQFRDFLNCFIRRR